MKLVTEKGRWALRDNSMIFGNIVWLCEYKDIYLYHLIDDNSQEIPLKKPIEAYLSEE